VSGGTGGAGGGGRGRARKEGERMCRRNRVCYVDGGTVSFTRGCDLAIKMGAGAETGRECLRFYFGQHLPSGRQ